MVGGTYPGSPAPPPTSHDFTRRRPRGTASSDRGAFPWRIVPVARPCPGARLTSATLARPRPSAAAPPWVCTPSRSPRGRPPRRRVAAVLPVPAASPRAPALLACLDESATVPIRPGSPTAPPSSPAPLFWPRRRRRPRRRDRSGPRAPRHSSRSPASLGRSPPGITVSRWSASAVAARYSSPTRAAPPRPRSPRRRPRRSLRLRRPPGSIRYARGTTACCRPAYRSPPRGWSRCGSALASDPANRLRRPHRRHATHARPSTLGARRSPSRTAAMSSSRAPRLRSDRAAPALLAAVGRGGRPGALGAAQRGAFARGLRWSRPPCVGVRAGDALALRGADVAPPRARWARVYALCHRLPADAWTELSRLAAMKPQRRSPRAAAGRDGHRRRAVGRRVWRRGLRAASHRGGSTGRRAGASGRARVALSAPAGAAMRAARRTAFARSRPRAPDGAPVIGWQQAWRVDAPIRAGERFRVVGDGGRGARGGGRAARREVRYTSDVQPRTTRGWCCGWRRTRASA